MFRKIILVSLDWTRPKDPPQSLGHASIVSYLLSKKINVVEASWSVNDSLFNIDVIIQFIRQHSDRETLIAFGAFVWNESHIQSILCELKAKEIPGVIVIGGPQISYLRSFKKEDIEDLDVNILEKFYPQGDIFIRGYAELALAELLQVSNLYKAIPGVHYKGRPDLKTLGYIDLALLSSPLLTGTLKPNKFLRWETKRGCPFRCAFCQHKSPELNRYYEFPIKRIMAEAKWIIDRPEIDDIAIVDPTFNIRKSHYIEVLKELVHLQYAGKLSLQCRIEFVTDEFLDIVEALNKTAKVTLEFGLQSINDDEEKVIKRRNNHAVVKKVLRDCVTRKIKIEVSLIYGLPLQTVNSFIDSLRFLVDCGVPIICAWPLMLLRGTELYEAKEQYGLKESEDIIPHVIESKSFSKLDYREMKLIAESLEIYNRLPKEEQADWKVSQKKTNTASLSYTHSLFFFRRHQNVLPDTYIIENRHSDRALQQVYDESFGVVVSRNVRII